MQGRESLYCVCDCVWFVLYYLLHNELPHWGQIQVIWFEGFIGYTCVCFFYSFRFNVSLFSWFCSVLSFVFLMYLYLAFNLFLFFSVSHFLLQFKLVLFQFLPWQHFWPLFNLFKGTVRTKMKMLLFSHPQVLPNEQVSGDQQVFGWTEISLKFHLFIFYFISVSFQLIKNIFNCFILICSLHILWSKWSLMSYKGTFHAVTSVLFYSVKTIRKKMSNTKFSYTILKYVCKYIKVSHVSVCKMLVLYPLDY